MLHATKRKQSNERNSIKMSLRIRRHSMECLKLYDIDQMKFTPPAVPPPRKTRQHLPEDFAFERYRFLCDMDRHRTDPVYAATPMFTTILPTVEIKYPRRILGLRIPRDIIKPRTPSASSSSSSSDSESTDSKKDSKDDESNDEDDNKNSEEKDNDDEDIDQSSSSSSSSPDDDINDDDDDNKGIVEQIFNRDKN